jgi:hypothetical protein
VVTEEMADGQKIFSMMGSKNPFLEVWRKQPKALAEGETESEWSEKR